MNWIERRQRARRRRRVARGATGLLALLGLAFTAGVFLPAEHLARAETLLALPPETVWRILTDLDGLPRWRSDLRGLERLPDLEGRPAWREIGAGGAVVLEVASAEPPRRLVVQRTEAGRPVFPIRTFELVDAPTGTRVTLTEADRTRNPLGRVLIRLGVVRPPLMRLLRDLDQRINAARRQVAVDGGG